MSSDGGRHEIEAAKQRLAAAKKLSSLTKAAYDSAKAAHEASTKEVKDAQEMLDKIEKRWEVIDIDNEADISVQNEGNSKKRKVSLSPQSIGASNRNGSTTSAAASSSSQTTNNDNAVSIATTLTTNGISKMYHMSGSIDEPSFKPILQVIELRKIDNRIGDTADRYKVILSDGQHFFSGVSSQIGLGLGCGVVSQYNILRITSFAISTLGSGAMGGAKIFILLGAENVRDGGSSRIGAPCDYFRTLTSTDNQNRLQTGSTASSVSTSSSNNNESSTSAGRAIGTANTNANEAPQQITVTGCGISGANGVYEQDALSIMGKSRYVKDGRWKGKNNRFAISRDFFGDSWSLYAHADGLAHHLERLYMVSSTDKSLPPKTGWKLVTGGGDSALTLNF